MARNLLHPIANVFSRHARAIMDCKYLYIDNIRINFVRRTIENVKVGS